MNLKKEWTKEIWNNRYLILVSIIILIIAIILDYAAGTYVKKITGVVAPDIILDNIPTFDLDFIYIYGAIIVVGIFFAYPLFLKVKELHKAISQFSLLVMVRSAFTCFTHLSIPSSALVFKIPFFMPFLNYSNDLFFSGHTAIPFLGFLLFKGKIRYFFLVSSIVMGLTVLLMHVHYTIDVFSAFFITYGTYKVGEFLFNKADKYFHRND